MFEIYLRSQIFSPHSSMINTQSCDLRTKILTKFLLHLLTVENEVVIFKKTRKKITESQNF